jgi:hypothetical protein
MQTDICFFMFMFFYLCCIFAYKLVSLHAEKKYGRRDAMDLHAFVSATNHAEKVSKRVWREKHLMLHRCHSRVDTLANDSANMEKAHQECNAQGAKKKWRCYSFFLSSNTPAGRGPRLALALSAILLCRRISACKFFFSGETPLLIWKRRTVFHRFCLVKHA